MMNKLLITCVVLLILCPVDGISQTTVYAQSQDKLPEKLTSQLALGARLAETANDIRDQFEANPLRLSEANNKSVLQHFKKAYAESRLTRDFASTLAKKMNAQHAKQVSRWLTASTTRSITNATKKYYTLQGRRERVITMYKMDQEEVSEQKKAGIDSLIKATSATESSVESSVIILKSILQASDQLSNQRNFSDSQLQAIVGNFKAQLQAQAAEEINREFLIKFYKVDDQALKQYAHFYQTEAGRWLTKAINQSMQTAYQSAADRLLKSL